MWFYATPIFTVTVAGPHYQYNVVYRLHRMLIPMRLWVDSVKKKEAICQKGAQSTTPRQGVSSEQAFIMIECKKRIS